MLPPCATAASYPATPGGPPYGAARGSLLPSGAMTRLSRPRPTTALLIVAGAVAGAFGIGAPGDLGASAQAAPPTSAVVLTAPTPGAIELARVRLVARGPGRRPALPRLVIRATAGATLSVVGGVARDRRPGRGRMATASIVIVRPAGAASASASVTFRPVGPGRGQRWRAVGLARARLDPVAIVRGTSTAPPALRPLARATPIARLAGAPIGSLGPQALARTAFVLAARPGAPSARVLASRLARALRADVPVIERRVFPLARPVAPPVEAPGICPAAPLLVALQSPAAAERVISQGAPGLRGLAARGVRHSMLSGIDAARQAGIVWGYEVVDLPAEEMARRLRAAVDAAPSHLAILDRVEGPRWSDGPQSEPPTIDPSSAGVALRVAMDRLDVPSPWGGTYAERVQVWIGPGLHTSIGAGLGPNRNLGRDGVPRRRTYNEAMRAMAAGGGVWLQMFHGPAPGRLPDPLTVREWQLFPTGFADLWTRLGGRLDRVHFLLAESSASPAGVLPPGDHPTSTHAAFAMARQPGTNLRILCNGPGALNVEAQAGAWLGAFSAAFPAAR